MTITTSSNKLKNLFKETLREVLILEFMKFRADLTPYISEKEQREIEKKYGRPARKIAKNIKIRI